MLGRLRERWAWTAVLSIACGPQVSVDDGGGTQSGTSDPSADGSGTTNPTGPTSLTSATDPTDTTDPGTTGPAPIPNSNAIDLLLVIDNSGSMGERQAAFVSSVGTLVDILDAAGADWRIGITTTDNGNPWCDGTSPEGGKLVASSCRARTQDFVFQGAQQVDATQAACLDLCPSEWDTIALAPPAGDSVVRPWIESTGGVTNLPAGLTAAQALQCMVPQGINGCGFEQPLENTYKAILRSVNEGEESFGFLRPDASLGILVLTDEADCSSNANHESIFLPDGNRVFWANPDDAAPTSALCWNAGVQCTGTSPYDECHSVDYDVNGDLVAPADAESYAVMRPVSRYIELLQELEAAKKQINPGAEVIFSLIGGVLADGSVLYDDSLGDPEYLLNYGIGPGCESRFGPAVPPVRMREVGDEFGSALGPTRFSVCDPEYSGAFETFGKILTDLLP